MNAARVAVEQVQRPFPLRLGMAEIFAGRQQPEGIHNLRDLLLETTRETADISLSLLIQQGIEHIGFQSRRSHALSIDGVETADCVTKDHEALWKAAEAVVVR